MKSLIIKTGLVFLFTLSINVSLFSNCEANCQASYQSCADSAIRNYESDIAYCDRFSGSISRLEGCYNNAIESLSFSGWMCNISSGVCFNSCPEE